MAHVDDGTLNALLDGELEEAEAAAVRAHVSACAECGGRFEDAKRFLDAAAELLGVLAPPVDARPAEPGAPAPLVAPVSPVGPAAPATVSAPSGAPRRVPKTSKEVAVDLDGATHKSPAIMPNFPAEGETVPAPALPPTDGAVRPLAAKRAGTARRKPDWATLAWAASVVLALGVGYMGNEVSRGRVGRAAPSADTAAAAAPSADTAAAAAPERREMPAPSPERARRVSAPPAAAARGGAIAARAEPPRSGAPEPAKPARAAADEAQPLGVGGARQDAGVSAGAAAVPSLAPQPVPSAAPLAGPPLAGDAANRAAARRLLDAAPGAAPRAVAAEAPSQAVPRPSFRVTDVDAAAASLGGLLRTLDGWSLESVKVGPGSLVPGALATRDVVRLVYSDVQVRRVNLDQQLVPLPRDTSIAARERSVPPALGVNYGDTLVTTGPNGEARIRWLDRMGLWMSLSGAMPADSLRSLLPRIR